MDAAFAYCASISDVLLQGDYIGESLDVKTVPMPEGTGSRGAASLRFFMDLCVSIRRLMRKDLLNLLRQEVGDAHVQACDALSLQLWLPFLRESFRMVGYQDISPQQKVWAIYHCSVCARMVQQALRVL